MKAGIAATFLFAAIAHAQWLSYPTPGVPRTKDGKPNLTAPAPKTADGKPDLSGVWVTRAGYTSNLAKDLKPGEVSFQPWAETLYKHRQENEGKEDPQAYCVLSGVPRENVVPYPFKILNSNGVMIILYEALHSYRQIFMDGRPLPKDPNPAWMGYSIGHWEGDTLVVDSVGFNDKTEINGYKHTDALHVVERFKRAEYNTVQYEVTLEDPNVFAKPWTMTRSFTLRPELSKVDEFVCENNTNYSGLFEKKK
jgi:hypothetical protein